jgi:energy-coupling factor transport system ATP-binding protein
MNETPAIAFEHISFDYGPDVPVLHEVSLTIPKGQFVALTGENGAGKTTLARHLIGLLRPTEGTVCVMGHDAAGYATGELARWVGFAFQNPEMQIFSPTVREELAFGPRNLGLEDTALDEAIARALDDFDLGALADYPPAALSFSLRRMVALAAIAAMNTPILVLDEPTVGLDSRGAARLVEWLRARHVAGATVLLITHDMELAAQLANRILVLHDGRLAADGPPIEVFQNGPLLAEAGLTPPFAVMLAERLGRPELAHCADPAALAQALIPTLGAQL